MPAAQRVVFRAPNQAVLEPFELDDAGLGPTEVVVRTRVTLISPGTELANLHDRLSVNTDSPTRAYPVRNVGYANVGTVVAAGAEVGVAPGQRVYTMGNHASLVRLDARERYCVPVPDALDGRARRRRRRGGRAGASRQPGRAGLPGVRDARERARPVAGAPGDRRA